MYKDHSATSFQTTTTCMDRCSDLRLVSHYLTVTIIYRRVVILVFSDFTLLGNLHRNKRIPILTHCSYT